MTPSIRAQMDAYQKMARETGYIAKPTYIRPGQSSLHDFCKTKEQADHLMKMLKLCEEEMRQEEAQAKAAAALKEKEA